MTYDAFGHMTKTKQEILEHYAEREPKSFVQFDGWYGDKWKGDPIVATDDDGRSMVRGCTTELMYGADVRLLVAPDSDPKEIVALLRQTVEWIESKPDVLSLSYALDITNTW